MRRPVRCVLLACVAVAAGAGPADAHVLLQPGRVPPGALRLFTVLSPDESTVPLTGLRLTVPAGVVVDSIADTPGYAAQLVRDQDHRIVAVSWQGGSTAPGHLALFRFSALTPHRTGAVTLIGVQTFADGSTRIWRSARLVVAGPPQAGGGRSGWELAGVALAGVVASGALVALGAPRLRRVRK